MKEKPLSIAVIGTGAAGLTAAYLLQHRHDITLIEKNDYIGGHTHTIMVDRGADREIPVDTGFIVMNHRTYPLLTRLLERLGVGLRDSEMSFGYYCENTGIEYSSRGANGFFARRSSIFKGSYYRILADILRFHRQTRADLLSGMLEGVTLEEYLRSRRYSEQFITHHIIPMGAAVWSTRFDLMMEFPASTFVRFLYNHGLLSFRDRPQWRTVVGGSHSYVRKILEGFKGTVIKNNPATGITRKGKKVSVSLRSGSKKSFDKVIIATHADEALKLLTDPTADEKRLLGPWTYEKNLTVLHTDQSVMPPEKRAWASWNFTREKTASGNPPLSLTYHMNRLQGLDTHNQYFVTLNRRHPIPDEKIIATMMYMHPQYTFGAVKTQQFLPTLNKSGNTFFCGSYFGYGFHEDAVRSGAEVAKLFGEIL